MKETRPSQIQINKYFRRSASFCLAGSADDMVEFTGKSLQSFRRTQRLKRYDAKVNFFFWVEKKLQLFIELILVSGMNSYLSTLYDLVDLILEIEIFC